MRKVGVLLLLTLSVFFAKAEKVKQIELTWNQGALTVVSELVLEKKVKRSRSAFRGGRSGAASTWFWRVVDSDGGELSKVYFADPTILCSGDHSKHVILDSTNFTIEVPLSSGAASAVEVFNIGTASATVVGEADTPTRGDALVRVSLKGVE